MRRWFDIGCMAVACALLCSCGAKESEKTKQVAPLRVHVLEVGEQTSVASHTYVGSIEEERRVPLSVETAGQVSEVLCRMGDRVRAGEVLLRVDSAAAVDARDAALATLRQAEDGYRRVADVYGAGGVTEQQLVEVETKLSQARAMASMAQRRVADCELRSPCDAVVGDVHAVAGQTISPVTTAVTLYVVDKLYVTFSVPEGEVVDVHAGDTGRMDVPAAGDRSVRVRVVEKGMKANVLSHTYLVRAEVLDREGLLPGMVSKVRMDRQQKAGVVVPAECVHVTPNGTCVWVVREDSTADRQPITIGQYVPNGVLATSGLQQGDRVVTDGFQKLYKGCKVAY